MAGPKKPPPARAERRAALRLAEGLARQRAKLAALEPGGSAERPIEVTSASLVEPRALSLRCLRCDAAEARLDAHEAGRAGPHVLRTLRTHCGRCGATRTLYVR
ncbi:MAG TPA: hypothetical protein VFS00_32625, partial [Polyangiaceae bacterium]|nr:hypothetical protein [Polyangiaceae bacterium]